MLSLNDGLEEEMHKKSCALGGRNSDNFTYDKKPLSDGYDKKRPAMG